MRELIIGDFHFGIKTNSTSWLDTQLKLFREQLIPASRKNIDRIIFLGDYLDEYPDEGITRNQSKENFKEIIDFKSNNPDKVILLLGNHKNYFV